MIEHKHIINKVFFEVNTPDVKTAYYLKDNLDMFLKQSLLPTIQSYFDSWGATMGNEILRFEKLELNINSKDVKDQLQLQLDIIKSLQKQLTQTESKITSEEKQSGFSTNTIATNKEKSEVATFFYFLETGQNPWWDSKKDFSEASFLETVISDKSFKTKFRECLTNPQARQRLIYQFPDEVLIQLFKTDKTSLRFPKKLIKNKAREQYWEALFRYLIDYNKRSLQKEMTRILVLFKKDVKPESICNESFTKEITSVWEENRRHQGLQKRNSAPQLLKFKILLIETVEKIAIKRLKTIKTNTVTKDISEVLADEVLYKELKEQFDIKVLKKIIDKHVEIALRVVNDKLEKLKKELLFFTSELLSEKIELFEYDEIKIADQKISINQYQEFSKKERTEPDPSLYIQNAGLVLLHPYLERFFSTLKILKENGRIQPEKLETAIHLLHYLATKSENQNESNLVFEKFLCGCPLDKPIRKKVRISKEMKEEAEELLKAIVQNWAALKNTSPDGLRENFIKRTGKLILDDPAKYRVVVERKTQDILLEKLPWNMTIIKLPWMNKMIFTEW